MASKRKKRTPAIYSDFGPPERRQHGPMEMEAVPSDMADTTNRDRVRAIETDDPLYVYRHNRVINATQRDAGMRLRVLWTQCGLEPSVCSRYEEMISSGSVQALRAASIDHYQRFVEAVRAVGPIAANEVMSVVCLQEFISRKQYEILRRGLDVLRRELGG